MELKLHDLEMTDKERLLAIFKDPLVSKYYMPPILKNKAAEDALFAKIIEGPSLFVGIYLDDELIGFINEDESTDDKIEIGYAPGADYQRKGYMQKALSLFMPRLFDKGYKTILAGAFKENRASLKVMQRCGMQKIAKEVDIEYRDKIYRCVYYALKLKK